MSAVGPGDLPPGEPASAEDLLRRQDKRRDGSVKALTPIGIMKLPELQNLSFG
jgi:hypothetical protein